MFYYCRKVDVINVNIGIDREKNTKRNESKTSAHNAPFPKGPHEKSEWAQQILEKKYFNEVACAKNI